MERMKTTFKPGDRVIVYVEGAYCPEGTVVEHHERLAKSRIEWDDGLNTWVFDSALVLASTATDEAQDV
jgi:hypothetical protein